MVPPQGIDPGVAYAVAGLVETCPAGESGASAGCAPREWRSPDAAARPPPAYPATASGPREPPARRGFPAKSVPPEGEPIRTGIVAYERHRAGEGPKAHLLEPQLFRTDAEVAGALRVTHGDEGGLRLRGDIAPAGGAGGRRSSSRSTSSGTRRHPGLMPLARRPPPGSMPAAEPGPVVSGITESARMETRFNMDDLADLCGAAGRGGPPVLRGDPARDAGPTAPARSSRRWRGRKRLWPSPAGSALPRARR